MNSFFTNSYLTFKDNSFTIPLGFVADNGYSFSLFTPSGLYFGDFLIEELKEFKVITI